MLARHRGITAVPQQGDQNGARTAKAYPVAKAIAIVPLIAQRSGARARTGIGTLRRSGPGTIAASAARWLLVGAGQPAPADQTRALLAAPQAALVGAVVSAGLAGGCLVGLAVGLAGPLRAEPAPRPADLKILVEKTTMREGTHWLGVYGRTAEPDQPGLWRVKLWREWSDRVEISSESIDCRPGHATRVGVSGGKVVVQTLNPGGPINPANRLDHLIWWATCVPEQAGRDPAGLASLARSLGFDGQQKEHFEVLPVPPLPHP